MGRAADAAGQGAVRFHPLGGGADLLIDCEAAQAEALAKRLSIYRLRRKIAIGVDDALGVFGREGEARARRPAPPRAWAALDWPVGADD
jgi:folate-binding Fe-S cluster repair protein YgfZ